MLYVLNKYFNKEYFENIKCSGNTKFNNNGVCVDKCPDKKIADKNNICVCNSKNTYKPCFTYYDKDFTKEVDANYAPKNKLMLQEVSNDDCSKYNCTYCLMVNPKIYYNKKTGQCMTPPGPILKIGTQAKVVAAQATGNGATIKGP